MKAEVQGAGCRVQGAGCRVQGAGRMLLFAHRNICMGQYSQYLHSASVAEKHGHHAGPLLTTLQ